MSPVLFFIIFFTCPGVGKIFLQINSAAVAFINILIAAWEGLKLFQGLKQNLDFHGRNGKDQLWKKKKKK